MKNLMFKFNEKAKTIGRRCVAILQSNKGNGELTGMLILILIVVVVGAYVLITYKEEIGELMSKVGDKIDEMFNY